LEIKGVEYYNYYNFAFLIYCTYMHGFLMTQLTLMQAA